MQIPETLKIGDLEIFPPLVMAPMAGVTHNAFRVLVEELGGCGLFYTEMLSASAVANESPEKSFYLQNNLRTTPLILQLLIYDESQVTSALDKLRRCRGDGIDINLGCTAPWIVRRGGGIALMRDLERCRKIVRRIRNVASLPLTAKMRLGEKPDLVHLKQLCLMLEGEGVQAVAVHGRLKGDRVKRPVKLEYIGLAKTFLKIPVIGNGDVRDLQSARRMFEDTGCDGVMIGRGAAVRPWIFRDIAKGLWGISREREFNVSCKKVYERYCELLKKFIPKQRQLGQLKEFTAYFSQNFPFGHTLCKQVQNADSMDGALREVRRFLARYEGSW